MKKTLLHYGFIIPAVLLALHQLSQMVLKTPIPFLDNYLDPFCASALILHALSLERALIFDQKLTLLDVFIVVVIFSICSEVLFPYFSARFTADFLDVLAILLGGIWFVLTRKDLITKKYE